MNKTINVLDVLINDIDAKGAMKEVVNYIHTDSVSVVEIVTTEVLMQTGQEPELKNYMEQFDLVMAGDREILEAAEITEHKRLQEIETNLFLKMVMRYLHKNHHRAFLLGRTKEEIDMFREYLETYYQGIQVVGVSEVGENTPDDLILNLINGAESDCVMTALPSPIQEAFIARNRALVNTRIWLALGVSTKNMHRAKLAQSKFSHFFSKFIFKKEIEREKRKKSL